MNVEFKNKHLKQLYEKGRSKKYRIPGDILRRYLMRIDYLDAVDTIYDLWKGGSLNFEKLQGYENRFSTRLSRKWRLEMETEWENEEKTTGKIFIIELSKHYGD